MKYPFYPGASPSREGVEVPYRHIQARSSRPLFDNIIDDGSPPGSNRDPRTPPQYRSRPVPAEIVTPPSALELPWACDFCNVARFRTFEEASAHEKVCPKNRQRVVLSSSETKSTVSGNDSAESDCYTFALTMPGDTESLSDRQCFVRSHLVEAFTATEADVRARHSKGAQKLTHGQVGIRCIHCASVLPKVRAERAMCYPSSISRIYQTVADMQRFHFEACSEIPEEMKQHYRSLKTTRPRGMGSPQSYWISSAKELGLVDTPNGIRSNCKQEKTSKVRSMPGVGVEATSSPQRISRHGRPRGIGDMRYDKHKLMPSQTPYEVEPAVVSPPYSPSKRAPREMEGGDDPHYGPGREKRIFQQQPYRAGGPTACSPTHSPSSRSVPREFSPPSPSDTASLTSYSPSQSPASSSFRSHDYHSQGTPQSHLSGLQPSQDSEAFMLLALRNAKRTGKRPHPSSPNSSETASPQWFDTGFCCGGEMYP